MRPWTRAGDDVVAHDGFVRVLQRPMMLPDGRQALWDIIDNPATVSILAVTVADEAVMVRQYRPGADRLVLSLPGGLVEAGEDPAAAGLRELVEETGYAGPAAELVASVDPPGHTRPRHTVVATGVTRVAAQDLDPLEDIEVVLVPLAELRSRLPSGELGTTEQTYLALDHLRRL